MKAYNITTYIALIFVMGLFSMQSYAQQSLIDEIRNTRQAEKSNTKTTTPTPATKTDEAQAPAQSEEPASRTSSKATIVDEPAKEKGVVTKENSSEPKLYDKQSLKKRLSYKFEGTYDELKAHAAQQKKPYILDMETSWCRVCKQMDHEVFADDAISQYIQSNYILYKLDAEQYKEVASLYGVNSYPTFIFFNHKNEELGRSQGYIDANGFMNTMKEFKPRVPHTKFSDFR